MKVLLDTNIFLRFYVKEDAVTHQECIHLLNVCNQGSHRPYTSNIVISEVIYVLSRLYKFPKNEVLAAVEDLLNLRNLTIIEKTDTPKAIELYKKYNLKIGDCLIATQVPAGVVFCSYDADFHKLSELQILTPRQLINKVPSHGYNS